MVPLHYNLSTPLPLSLNAVPDIPDSEIKVNYQCIIGSILYLTICTRPDIAYLAMALGQFNANPNCSPLLAAKGVLHYLIGTLNLALEYNGNRALVGTSATAMVPCNCVFLDADWALD